MILRTFLMMDETMGVEKKEVEIASKVGSLISATSVAAPQATRVPPGLLAAPFISGPLGAIG
jgi:hypothetical protein